MMSCESFGGMKMGVDPVDQIMSRNFFVSIIS